MVYVTFGPFVLGLWVRSGLYCSLNLSDGNAMTYLENTIRDAEKIVARLKKLEESQRKQGSLMCQAKIKIRDLEKENAELRSQLHEIYTSDTYNSGTDAKKGYTS